MQKETRNATECENLAQKGSNTVWRNANNHNNDMPPCHLGNKYEMK